MSSTASLTRQVSHVAEILNALEAPILKLHEMVAFDVVQEETEAEMRERLGGPAPGYLGTP